MMTTALRIAPEPLDPLSYGPNNEAMWKRAAKRVKAWRRDHDDMNQVMFAKRARISVGCLQGFEGATRHTRKQNLAKIAQAIGLTLEQLLADDDLPSDKPNPLTKDLRPEDLRLANQFHHAGAEAKYAVKSFLDPSVTDDRRERVAVILARLLRLEDDGAMIRIEAVLQLLQDPGATEPRSGAKKQSS